MNMRTAPCGNGNVSCWICLEGCPGQPPLRRDCSCRGSSGYCHLSCLVEYAKRKSGQVKGRGLNKFRESWTVCPNCLQRHQNQLALDLANEFLSFVSINFPEDQARNLAALDLKLHTLSMRDTVDHPKQEKDATETVNKILSMIGNMKLSSLSLPRQICHIEARAYNKQGVIALALGTMEGASRAVDCFERSLAICRARGFSKGMICAESNLVSAKVMHHGGNDMTNDDMLEKRRELYMAAVERDGESSSSAIPIGQKLVIALKNNHSGIEAERLLTKLVAICTRVHGKEHSLAVSVLSCFKACRARMVEIKSSSNMSEMFQALRYEEGGKQCVLVGPVSTNGCAKREMLQVATKDIHITNGTPVVCNGLMGISSHLNGKIGDVRGWNKKSYLIHFEEKGIKPGFVKKSKVRILFDLPVLGRES